MLTFLATDVPVGLSPILSLFIGMWKPELFHFLLNNPVSVMITASRDNREGWGLWQTRDHAARVKGKLRLSLSDFSREGGSTGRLPDFQKRSQNFTFFFERERVRQSVSGGGTERQADRESEAGSRLWAVSTESNVGLELTSRKIVT